MTTIDMRSWVKTAYPGQKWADKVDKMSDQQIVALYYGFVQKGKIKN